MPVPITNGPAPPGVVRPTQATQPPAAYELPDADQLAAQHDESYRNRNGLQFKGILDDEQIAAKGVPVWKTTAGNHLIDILPYRITERHPRVVMGKAQAGTWGYVFAAWMHDNVGPNKDRYMCLAKTYGLPCPICEYRNQRSGLPDATDEEIKALRPKQYATEVYNILDRNQMDKGVQVWVVSGFHFGRHIETASHQPAALGGGKIVYTNWRMGTPPDYMDGGRHIAFTVETPGGQNQNFSAHTFHFRKADIPIQYLQQAYCLDDLIHVPTYDEVRDMFFAGASSPDLETQQPMTQSQPAPGPSPGVCPSGAVIGQDYGRYGDCGGCPDADRCWAMCPPERQQEILAAAEVEAAPPPPPLPPPPMAAPHPRPAVGPVASAGPRPMPLRRQG